MSYRYSNRELSWIDVCELSGKGILESGCSREGYSQPGNGCIIASFSVLLLILFFSSSPGLAEQTHRPDSGRRRRQPAEEIDPTPSDGV